MSSSQDVGDYHWYHEMNSFFQMFSNDGLRFSVLDEIRLRGSHSHSYPGRGKDKRWCGEFGFYCNVELSCISVFPWHELRRRNQQCCRTVQNCTEHSDMTWKEVLLQSGILWYVTPHHYASCTQSVNFLIVSIRTITWTSQNSSINNTSFNLIWFDCKCLLTQFYPRCLWHQVRLLSHRRRALRLTSTCHDGEDVHVSISTQSYQTYNIVWNCIN